MGNFAFESSNNKKQAVPVSKIEMSRRFFKYYITAQNRYRIHSPFVFEFVEQVLEDNRMFYAFEEIEDLRHILFRTKKKITVEDFGAGSKVMDHNKRSISQIAKRGITSPRNCRLLFRIVHYFKPKILLELGTSLGVATLYQAAAAQNSKVVTIEGCANIAKVAQQNFKLMKRTNIQSVVGTFEQTLPEVLDNLPQLDFAFIDGNHQEQPTVDYFEQCLQKATPESVFVFDDIHWSQGMEAAWEKIKQHPQVKLSIDLFFFGLVFFRTEFHEKAYYTLIPSSWKPF